MSKKKSITPGLQKGFTIIEVMIVLAIAGLIMVVVLVAIPQLQRNQRDTARQSVANRLSTELGTYSTNNDGRYPFTSDDLDGFEERYIDGGNVLELTNPQTGSQYAVVLAADTSDAPAEDELMIYPGAECDGESVSGTLSSTSRQYAIRVALERTNTFFCTDNI
jgi:prepilin-type N-terminal cleavage/methylation domain-containing protein